MIATPVYRSIRVMVVGLLLALGANCANAAYVNLYVFGDSLSDAGNAYAITGFYPPFPYAQRFSNGPVAVEQLAAGLGIAGFGPSASGGTDYAVGGAQTGPDIFTGSDNYLTYAGLSALANTGIELQVGNFAGAPPAFDPSTSLFFVWGGANDLFAALTINPSAAPTVAAGAVANLANEIGALAAIGADPVRAELGRFGGTQRVVPGVQRGSRVRAGPARKQLRVGHSRVRRLRLHARSHQQSRRLRTYQCPGSMLQRGYGLRQSGPIPVLGFSASHDERGPVPGGRLPCERSRTRDSRFAGHRAGRARVKPAQAKVIGVIGVRPRFLVNLV
jgi:hypothetical protein